MARRLITLVRRSGAGEEGINDGNRDFKRPFSSARKVLLGGSLVKHASSRSRIENFPGHSSARGDQVSGRFGVSGERGPKGGCRLKGDEPDRIRGDQAIWGRSNARAGARGGARIGKPRCARILAITVGSRMAAMIAKVPPQYHRQDHSDRRPS
jgi:hypothetical protein